MRQDHNLGIDVSLTDEGSLLLWIQVTNYHASYVMSTNCIELMNEYKRLCSLSSHEPFLWMFMEMLYNSCLFLNNNAEIGKKIGTYCRQNANTATTNYF